MIPSDARENRAVRSSANKTAPPEGVSRGADNQQIHLLQGDLVSLYHVRQEAVTWRNQKHEQIEIMVLFAAASCLIRWQDKNGEWRETLRAWSRRVF